MTICFFKTKMGQVAHMDKKLLHFMYQNDTHKIIFLFYCSNKVDSSINAYFKRVIGASRL